MPSIAFLGLGQMGVSVAQRLHEKGHDLVVWNRSREKAEPLASAGVRVAETAGDAARGSEIVFTMLTDDHATEAVVFGREGQPGILEAMPTETIHVSLSTISVRLARRLEAAHGERGQHFVGAPVFGRPKVAQEGRLWIVAAGADDSMAKVKPLLEQIGRGVTVVSQEPWQAHALKLGGNLMITSMNQTLGEAFVYARSQGIDPALFARTVNEALFQSKLYESYSNTILNPPERPGATVSLGAKDTRLAREAAADAGTRMGLADYFAEVFRRAEEAGWKDEDWAVGQYRVAELQSPLSK